MALVIKKAQRTQKKLKAALIGVSGSGKTFSALEIAMGLKNGGRVLLVDSESDSATLYGDDFDFDHANLPGFGVDYYCSAIDQAVKGGFDVLVIDSLSHAWEWLLEKNDEVTKRSRSGNSYTSWAEVTPIYKKLIQKIVAAPIHIICTMRAKAEYVLDEYTGKDGKKRTQPKKVGLAPIFRAGGEYEFDLVATMDMENNFIVDKTRIRFLGGKVISKPTRDLGEEIRDWLASGKAEEETAPYQPEPNSSKEGCISEQQAEELLALAEQANVEPETVWKAANAKSMETILLGKQYERLRERLMSRIAAELEGKDDDQGAVA